MNKYAANNLISQTIYHKIWLFMATTSSYTVKLPKILDIIEYNGFFNLPNVRITITDRDTGNVLYNDVPVSTAITLNTIVGYDLRISASKDHYKTESRSVYIGNPEGGVYKFIKFSNDKELVLIALEREEEYCGSGTYMIDYVHGFYSRKFDNFTLVEPEKVLVSTSGVARDLTSKLNVCLTNPISTPSSISDFKSGFVSELNDGDSLHTLYVKGPENEDENALDYGWNSKHAYIFEDAFKLFVNEKNREYLTFEAYDDNTETFSVTLNKQGTPYAATVQYRYFDKDSGKSMNYTGGTTYVVTSSEMTQIRNSFATGKTCVISSSRVNFTLYDRISYNGVIYEVEETENGGYRLVESSSDYEWTDYTFGTTLTSNDNGIVIQFRRSPNDSNTYFSKNINNYYYYTVTGGYVNVYGSVNTLLTASDNKTFDKENASDKYIFYKLFYNGTYIKKVSNLKLKSEDLTEYCYYYMFYHCNINSVPLISALNVDVGSCSCMLSMCNNIYSLPDNFFIFNISQFYANSCNQMFYECSNLSLSSDQAIIVDSCGEYSFYKMFSECNKNRHCNITIGPTSVINVPDNAFEQMFYRNQSAIKSNIKIHVSNVGSSSFKEMFYSCIEMYFPTDVQEYYVIIDGTISEAGCYKMFEGCSRLKNESTFNLSIFSTSIGEDGCARMFYDCEELKIPILFPNHASDLTTNTRCFSNMFSNCKKLVTTPSIRVNVLADNACEYMFYKCETIKDASSIFSTTGLTLSDYSCQYMFYGCENLEIAPYLKNSVLADYCFSHMFEDCLKLRGFDFGDFASTTIPSYAFEYMFKNSGIEYIGNWDNIETVLDHGCQYMFSNSKIKYPPEKGVTSLREYSYFHMFENCVLLSDMELRANTIPNYAYAYMFSHATIFNFKKTFKVRNFLSCGDYAFSHMFYYAKCISETGSIVCGKFIIKRVNATNPYYVKLFQSRSTLRNGADYYNYYRNNQYYWVLPFRDAFVDSDHIALVTSTMKKAQGVDSIQTAGGPIVYWIDTIDLRYSNGDKFELSEFLSLSDTACTVYDDLNSDVSAIPNGEYNIIKKDENFTIYFGQNTTGVYCCEYMFSHCEFVKDGYMIRFTSSNLGSYAFSHMFDGCPYLVSIPKLNNISSVSTGTYEYMFANCNNLVQISEYGTNKSLQNYGRKLVDLVRNKTGYNSNASMYYYYIFKSTITLVPINCCLGMFKNCKHLMYGPAIQNISPGAGAYEEMFFGCSILQKIRYERTSAPTASQFGDWVKNVRSSGNFYRSSTNWNVNYGDSFVPTGWSVVND